MLICYCVFKIIVYYARELFLCIYRIVGHHQVWLQVIGTWNMKQVYAITLRARDGRERTDLWWLPTAAVHQDLCEKVRRRGLEIANKKEIL